MRCFDCLKQCDDTKRKEWFIGAKIIGINRIDIPRCPECFQKEVYRNE